MQDNAKQYIIDKLIIVVGQYIQFEDQRFAKEFEVLINELSRLTNTTQDGAIDILTKEVEARESDAA